MLRTLSSYYYKEAGHLFCVSCFYTRDFPWFILCFFRLHEGSTIWMQVRIAQGLVHMGKGLLTLSPYHSDRFLLSPYVLFFLSFAISSMAEMFTTIGAGRHLLDLLLFCMLAWI